MDDQNFEQQFVQNLKTSQPQPTTSGDTSKRQTMIMVVLAVVTLIESIILIIVLSQYFSLVNSNFLNESYPIEDENVSDIVDDLDYIYDDNGNLEAINIKCENEDGSYVKLATDNSYELYNSTSNSRSTGTYSIARGSIISLSGDSAKTIFYDGLIIADGTTAYDCWEDLDEIETE